MTDREGELPQLDCTVVIPVYNRGEALAAGSESLRGQSIGIDHFEVIYVDDGSNDGYTPALIDDVVAATPNARVFHEPPSGSPGRPRNVGLAHARGEFVFFSDHDDWFDPRALERLVGWARQHDSDVVIGKVVGHGRRTQIPRVFKASRASMPAAEAMISLTPHKLFRRAFLEEHAIRFPEGKRRLEDHHFVTHAYLHAHTISVYADHVCYHHNDPGTDENFSQTRSDPALYIDSNVAVIELIRRHTEHDLALRDAMLVRPVLHELIKKAAPGGLRQIDDAGEAAKHRAIRTALREHVPSEVIDRLGAFPRATANAVLRDDRDTVVQITETAAGVALVGELVDLSTDDTQLLIDFRATVVAGDGAPQDSERPVITDLEALVISRDSSVQWHLATTYVVGDHVVSGRSALDLGGIRGDRIDSGIWDVVLRADVLGLGRRARLSVPAGRSDLAGRQLTQRDSELRAETFVTERRGTLAVRVSS